MILIQWGRRLPGVIGKALSSFQDMQLASKCCILGGNEKQRCEIQNQMDLLRNNVLPN